MFNFYRLTRLFCKCCNRFAMHLEGVDTDRKCRVLVCILCDEIKYPD